MAVIGSRAFNDPFFLLISAANLLEKSSESSGQKKLPASTESSLVDKKNHSSFSYFEDRQLALGIRAFQFNWKEIAYHQFTNLKTATDCKTRYEQKPSYFQSLIEDINKSDAINADAYTSDIEVLSEVGDPDSASDSKSDGDYSPKLPKSKITKAVEQQMSRAETVYKKVQDSRKMVSESNSKKTAFWTEGEDKKLLELRKTLTFRQMVSHFTDRTFASIKSRASYLQRKDPQKSTNTDLKFTVIKPEKDSIIDIIS